MRMAKLFKATVVAGAMAACICMFAACSGAGGSGSSGVAATVNGTEIPEEKVTSAVQAVREQSDLMEEQAWAEFLIENGMTPDSVRKQIIDSLIDQELIKSGAESLGITVDSTEIDSYVDKMKENFDDEDAWADALKQAGFTEEEYRNNIESSLRSQKLSEHFSETAELSDKELLKSAQDYVTYYDGAKRSSHILFGVDDTTDEKAMNEAREKAQALLDKINNGEIDFADAAKENSTDGSATKGGDVGWDMLSNFVTEYSDALDKLEKDEVSGLVETQYGIHIIKCTDVFNAPKKLKKLSDLPDEIRTTIENMAKSSKSSDDYNKWIADQREAADIVINDMPADVPYNVDLSKYENADSDESAESEEAATADGEEASDEADQVVEVEEASDEAASDEAASDEAASGEAASDEAASDEAASDEAAEVEGAPNEGEGEEGEGENKEI